MSLEAVVAEAGAALGQGRSLYGPAASGGGFSSTPGIGDAGSKVGSGAASSQQQWTGAAGGGYRDQAAGTVRALDATSEADRGTGAGVTEGGNQARQGRVGADGVVDDARRSVTALAPATGTQAGKQEMVAQLQDRVNQMRQRLLVSEQRNMLLAQQIRAAGGGYPRAGGGAGGGIPMFGGGQSGGGGFGGGSGGGSGGGFTMPNLSSLMNLGKTRPGKANPAASPMDQARVGSGGGPLAQQAVKAALTKLGHPYVYGATGPNAFDCSSLVQWAYAQAGVTIGRDTRAQIAQGFAVASGDVNVGDAVFPTKSFGSDGKPGPGHVMLAISPTQVIEASTEKEPIKISPMPASFVARRFVA